MNTIKIGPLSITRISLGAGRLGDPAAYDTCASIMDAYLDMGGSCIDLARIYASGQCEADFGKWLHARGGRDKLIISTKGAHPDLSAMHITRITPDELTYDLNLSLTAMETDYADIYYLHRDNPKKPVEEIMPTLHAFVKAGKVRVLGASNWTAGRIAQANAFALENGLTPFSVSQINWSLAETTPAQTGDVTHITMNDVEFNWYAAHDFPIMAYSPQARGYFSRYINGDIPLKLQNTYSWFDVNLQRAEHVKELSAQMRVSPSSLIVAYLLKKYAYVSPILGFSSMAQMEDSMPALNITLSDEQLTYLEA